MSVINYRADKQILVSVKGHPYPRDAFFELFESLEDIACTAVEQPASQVFMQPAMAEAWDAFVFYDMPGIDFSSRPPTLVAPDQAMVAGFLETLEQGKGCVFLHHSLAAWPAWPEYAEIVGGRFLYLPGEVRGEPRLDSGYRHAVSYQATVLADHPVTAGVSPTFAMTDELYLCEVFENDVIPLLASDYAFERNNFWSARQAAMGQLHNNDDWPHSPGSNLIGWVKHFRNSPIVYLQMGDDVAAYSNPEFRRLLHSAMRWVMSSEAHHWARVRNSSM